MQNNGAIRWMLEESERNPDEAIRLLEHKTRDGIQQLKNKKRGGAKNQPVFDLIGEDDLRDYINITIDSELDGLHLKTVNYEYSFLDMSEQDQTVEVERTGYNKPNTLEKALACHITEHYRPEKDNKNEELALKALTGLGLAYLTSKTVSELYRRQDYF